MTEYRKKFHRIAQRLTNLELQRGESKDFLSMDGILEDLRESRGSEFLLGSYSEAGIKMAFDKFGITRELGKLGFDDLIITMDTRDPYRQMLRLYNDTAAPDHMLGEIVLHKAKFTSRHSHLLPAQYYPLDMIYVEWLILQNPTVEFSEERPPLPGQDHPGLGIGKQVLELLYLAAKHQHTQGLLIVPHYYHTALIFSQEFRFINLEYQALLNRIEEDLDHYPLTVRAWAVERGTVYHKHDNHRFHWDPEEQILASYRELRNFFHSESYEQQVKAAESKFAFYLDPALLRKKLPQQILDLYNDSEFRHITK